MTHRLVVAVLLAACATHRPSAFDPIATDWTVPFDQAVQAVGGTCALERIGDTQFQRCAAGTTVHVFGGDARLTLVRQADRLAGYEVDFSIADCKPDLVPMIAQHYGVSTSGSTIYTIRDDGVVWFDDCNLIVGNPSYARYFEAEQLRRGMSGLGRGFSPH